MSGWKPIATANPVDGSKADLWVQGYGYGYRYIDCTWGVIEYDPDPKYLRKGWLDRGGNPIMPEDNITHWMEVPEPPADVAE